MKKALCLSLSVIEADNRVIRQCDALVEAGFIVHAVGLIGKEKRQKDFRFNIIHVGSLENRAEGSHGSNSYFQKLLNLNRALINSFKSRDHSILLKYYLRIVQIVKTLLRIQQLNSLFRYLNCKLDINKAWEKIYWRSKIYADFSSKLDEIDMSNIELVIANDWHMLPIANELNKKFGIKIAYDSHEHALSENNHLLLYKYLTSSFIFQLERDCLKNASLVMSVSEGILDALKHQYRLNANFLVVRSTPYYNSMPFNPVDPDNIKVYFHGYLKENRHLDTILESLVHLGPNYSLIFVGAHSSSTLYEEKLFALAKRIGVHKRFSIEPMASHSEIYTSANKADIGLSLPPLNSLHSDMALPNKFFEYVMSGLAIGVSDVKEMGSYVKKYEVGFVVDKLTPEDIAKKIQSFTPDQLNVFKRRSLDLAKELNWENEKKIFSRSVLEVCQRDN